MLFWDEMNDSNSPPSYTEALNLPAPVRPSTAVQKREEGFKPKLCKMETTSAGYGFHLNGIQGESGHYIKEVRIKGVPTMQLLPFESKVVRQQFVSGGEGWSG